MRQRLGVRGALVFCGLFAGCAHALPPQPATDPQLAQLRAQLAERDRTIRELEGRLALSVADAQHGADQRAIERDSARERGAVSEPGAGSPAEARAATRGATGRDDVLDAHDAPAPRRGDERKAKEEPRPFLRLHAQAEPGASARRWQPSSGAERLSVVPLPGAAPSREAAADDLYVRAIDLVRRREFPEALRELDAFLQSFADDPRTLRALFWRGEVLFAQREYARALESFEAALAREPRSDKAPDTLLRIARCLLRLGASERARATIAQLEAEFPESEAARQIKQGPEEDG